MINSMGNQPGMQINAMQIPIGMTHIGEPGLIPGMPGHNAAATAAAGAAGAAASGQQLPHDTHQLSTIASYLRSMQSPDFQSTLMPISSQISPQILGAEEGGLCCGWMGKSLIRTLICARRCMHSQHG